MTVAPISFAQGVRQDLVRYSEPLPEAVASEVAMALLCAGRSFTKSQMWPEYLLTGFKEYAQRLTGQLRLLGLDALAENKVSQKGSRWYVYPLPGLEQTVSAFLAPYLSHQLQDHISSTPELRRGALRGAFLASGQMADPQKFYQIEWHIKKKEIADLLILLLHGENIEPLLHTRSTGWMVYIKAGQAISDFLAATGAHNSLLRFETIRIDREMQSQVNRVVNCDSANANRQAEASARQIARLRDLLAHPAAGQLPEELYRAAELRLENPGLSLRDLGAMMEPPLGKSGMNHRLQKLEKLAEEVLEE